MPVRLTGRTGLEQREQLIGITDKFTGAILKGNLPLIHKAIEDLVAGLARNSDPGKDPSSIRPQAAGQQNAASRPFSIVPSMAS